MSKIRSACHPPKKAIANRAAMARRTKASMENLIQAHVVAHYRTYKRLDPTEILITLLRFKQASVSMYSYKDICNFFYRPSADDYESHDMNIVQAARNGNVEALERLRNEGKRLTCCNRAGESILHAACRRGHIDVVRYLVEELQIPVNICDDYGRTVLHDAFWTSTPNFALVDILVDKCPDLLFVKDMRGHCPLNYAPNCYWKTWVKYFAKDILRLKPRVLQQQQY